MWAVQSDSAARMQSQQQQQQASVPHSHAQYGSASYPINHYAQMPQQQQQHHFQHPPHITTTQPPHSHPSPPTSSPLATATSTFSTGSSILSAIPKVPEAKNTLIAVSKSGKSEPVSGASIFNTPIDSLVRELRETGAIPHPEESAEPVSATTPTGAQPTGTPTTASKKTHVCPECNKAFSQKAQLTTHMRAHTDEKPYVCPLETCRQRFTQQGNMRTHLRRHTGERPYICESCGKSFAQSGNLRAHEATHNRQQYFTCLFANCGRRLTQLGNLKSHHNRFHAEELKKIMETLRLSKGKRAELPAYERDLCVYITDLYKNSNRGIKGRGKNRRISDFSMRSKNAARAAPANVQIPTSQAHSGALPSPASSMDHPTTSAPATAGAQMTHLPEVKITPIHYAVNAQGQPIIAQAMPNNFGMDTPLDSCPPSGHSPVAGVLTPPPDQPGWSTFRPDINRGFSHASTATSDSHHSHPSSVMAPPGQNQYHAAHSSQTASGQYAPAHQMPSQAHYSGPHLSALPPSNLAHQNLHTSGSQLPSPTNQFQLSDGSVSVPPSVAGHPAYHSRHPHYPPQHQHQPTSHPTSAPHDQQTHSYSYNHIGSAYSHPHGHQAGSSYSHQPPQHHAQGAMGMPMSPSGPGNAPSQAIF